MRIKHEQLGEAIHFFCIPKLFSGEAIANPLHAEAPPMPPDSFNISQDDLIRNAQVKLNMDARNNYNCALCGPRGTGRDIRIGGC